MRQILSHDNINESGGSANKFSDVFNEHEHVKVPGVDFFPKAYLNPEEIQKEREIIETEELMSDPNFNPFLLDPKYLLKDNSNYHSLRNPLESFTPGSVYSKHKFF